MSRTIAPAASTPQSIALLCFLCLAFYRFGAANIEAFVNYPFWREMGSAMSNAEFLHLRTHLWRVYPLLVLPFVLEIVAAVCLFWLGHPRVPRWMLGAIVALLVIPLLSTIFIQLPIQNYHTQIGYDRAAFDRLIMTDLWLRKLPSVLECLLAIRIMWRVIVK